ncbi:MULTISPECIES: DUF4440 domain-containing protein [Klebsiella]|jgi:hypothetical protein|uniref:DUF4440 domain-containing protein n=2 Tax=Klebsiella aerogenes TaxID=548 RepID=A0AAJ5J6Z1_KLEAE|nr:MULTISPECIES: DUF4440 domain-containing protein [Klebsiella]MCL6714981.1 DUF4440 domain-containing protein [Klebsiella sp. T2.Ur]AEG95303.1 putative cytoplasmic protein [Klebsiella aerogenes KCTC 2190]ATX89192.1 DUF4440 domain-containing protein [Klebsiella aerogenes]ATY01232.1 DUF4440 domain-containing protein [Klebsiella aerogenes]EIV2480675.1 DUF4440 domain-containing protein [Klebsiella aerogenes]
MNPWIQEVIDAHVIIEQWLGRKEGSAQALMSRFAQEFTMVPISGAKMDYPTVSGFFHSAGGSRPGLSIVVDNAQVLSEWHDGGAVLYRESQTLPEQGEVVRWSTAIFQRIEGKILWRHLQETRIG